MARGTATPFQEYLRELLSVRGQGEGVTAAALVDPRASAPCRLPNAKAMIVCVNNQLT